MQDNAKAHGARATLQTIQEKGIELMYWPALSPDLNPIESCWDWIKDWIQDVYGTEENPSYQRLRQIVQEAWQALPQEYLVELLSTMKERCEDVIKAEGGATKW